MYIIYIQNTNILYIYYLQSDGINSEISVIGNDINDKKSNDICKQVLSTETIGNIKKIEQVGVL